MLPTLATFTKYVNGQQYEIAEYDAPDFLLNTVVGLHELHYPEETPAFLQGYELQNFYTLDILFADGTGKAQYEDTWHFLMVETKDCYYLLEVGSDSQIEVILSERQIISKDDVLAYAITEEDFSALGKLFVKP